MNISLEDIKKICVQYDKYWGCYPESYYEGKSLYEYIEASLMNKEYEEVIIKEEWEKMMKEVDK